MPNQIKTALLTGACAFFVITGALAQNFNIPGGELKAALDAYIKQAGVTVMYLPTSVKGVHTNGVEGDLSADNALARILSGTGFSTRRTASGAIGVVHNESSYDVPPLHVATAAAPTVQGASLETVTVTSSKIGGDVQNIPIAITALSQEQLQAMKVEGGPDLLKEIPNMTFTKTNFTSYNIQIRGIGTQAISVTTDPAVAVAFNDMPFIRNHLFEQEFFDVGQVEVLRGPQGTLYGRNATAGVVNVVSAKPTDEWEAMVKVETGNYDSRRLVGMLNIPVYDDLLDIRFAGAWTKRNGYSFNEATDKPIDGRDLWSGRVTIGFKPIDRLQTYLIWEHFSEDDDRVRSAKQLCKKDVGPDVVDGLDLSTVPPPYNNPYTALAYFHGLLSQGCLPTSLYSPDAFETPNGQSLPYVFFGEFISNRGGSSASNGFLLNPVDPYASTTQSRDLRVIQSALEPTYKAKNDVVQLNADYKLTPTLTLTSQTGYNSDRLRSTEDFNRFNTAPGIFANNAELAPGGVYCDPQLGCSDRMVGEDLSREHAWQFNQEFRLASNFEGPLNFSAGGNYTQYQTVEDYFVFINLVSLQAQLYNGAGAGDFTHCYDGDPANSATHVTNLRPVPLIIPFDFSRFFPNLGTFLGSYPAAVGCSAPYLPGTYIDPNPITHLDGNGHNYFRSENPYRLQSFAGFGEVYYQVIPDLKITGGLRWTDDQKTFWNIPSWVFLEGGGYPVTAIINQEWREWTGRLNANWTPKLDFTDQTSIYASYSRGYKGGGANPPGPEFDRTGGAQGSVAHPATFAPEFVNAYEIGSKNTLADGSVTLNGDVFYYDYMGYQISQIVDRTSINLNFNAKVTGAELESTWEPVPGLRFNFAGGYETSSVDKGQSAIDLMDRTAGHSDWMVIKPQVTDTSNCIFPSEVVRQYIEKNITINNACESAYTILGAALYHTPEQNGIVGFDPATAPNDGAGFSKDLSGNQLPNTPHFTVSFGAQYGMPINAEWTGVLRGDFYYQASSFARIFNDVPYDQLRGWSSTNISLLFANNDGWSVEGYVKNVFDTTAITGAFLNSDDTGLTTNVFITDPRLIGLSITKNW